VFQSHRHHNWDLYSVLADGSGLERLTTSVTADWAPAWSSDGSQVAFTTANYDNGREDIAVLDLESSVVLRFVVSNTLELEPDWQPVPLAPPHKRKE
jgi:TolB protein